MVPQAELRDPRIPESPEHFASPQCEICGLIVKRISAKAGGPVDTSRDYELTDWTKLDHVVAELVQSIL